MHDNADAPINLDFPNLICEKIHETQRIRKNSDGPRKLESSLKEIANREAVCVDRYSNALHLVLKYSLGYRKRLPKYFEIICPELCSKEMREAAEGLNIKVRYVKCDGNTGLISLEEVEKARNDRTVAVVGRHTFGLPCHVGYLPTYCERHKLKLLYDGGKSFFGHHDGCPLGSFGDIEIFSMENDSFLSAGNGAVVFTGDVAFSHFFRGVVSGALSKENRIDSRLGIFSSLVFLTNLKFLKQYRQKSKSVYGHYLKLLSEIPGIRPVYFNELHVEPNYHTSAVVISEGDFGMKAAYLCEYLKSKEIACELQENNILTLPSGSNFSMMKVEDVVSEIKYARNGN